MRRRFYAARHIRKHFNDLPHGEVSVLLPYWFKNSNFVLKMAKLLRIKKPGEVPRHELYFWVARALTIHKRLALIEAMGISVGSMVMCGDKTRNVTCTVTEIRPNGLISLDTEPFSRSPCIISRESLGIVTTVRTRTRAWQHAPAVSVTKDSIFAIFSHFTH